MPNDKDSTEITMGGTQKRRLSAIMFTDIKGFSSIMENDEVTAVGLVKAQREIVRKHIRQYDGEERETIGDAFLVIFDSAVNAVRSAIDIQRELWEFNQTREPDKQVWIRIGIHLGDILIEEGSVFGEGVNLAARVEPLAEPGGICVTRQVYDQVKHHLDISVSHLGVRELKNITDVPDIYRIRLSTTAPREPISLKERLSQLVDTPAKLAVVIGALGFIAGLAVWWTFFSYHEIYARQMARIGLDPEPRFVISRAEATRTNHYFKFTKRGLRFVEVKEITKPYLFPQDNEKLWEFEPAKKTKRDYPDQKYVYMGGKLREEHVFDRFGVLQYKIFFEQDGHVATLHDRAGFIKTFENQIAGFGFEFDPKGRTAKRENRNAFGILVNDDKNVAIHRFVYNDADLATEESFFDVRGNPVEDKDGIAIITREYDNNGLLLKETHLDRYKVVRESIKGVAHTEWVYDGHGRPILEKYSNRTGQPSVNSDGACAQKFGYDSKGRLTETTYLSCSGAPKATHAGFATKRYEYDGDQIAKEMFLDEKGMPTANNDGVAIVTIARDDSGHVSAMEFFGTDGKPVTNEDHAHAIRYYYDNLGRPARRVFLGLDGNPTIAANGYAELRVSHNEHDEATEWAFLDTQGTLMNGRDGYALVRNNFDQFGNVVSKEFFDKNNAPAFGREAACHKIEMKYDEKGNLDESRCLDGEGKLTAGMANCALTRYDFDPYGKITQFECFVEEGKLIDDPSLPSILSLKYDNRGYVSEVRAFDAEGKPAERHQGAAIWKCIYDDYGNQLEIATYDRNGHPINNPRYRAAIFRREFDDRGHELKAQAFDQNGLPTTGIWGFAEIRYQYDDRGYKTSESYYDERGEPAKNWQDVHESRTLYDDSGRVREIINIGVNNEPVANNNGFAAMRYTYDEHGLVSRIDYLDPDDNLTTNKKLKCSYQEFDLDDRGNTVGIKRFDGDGKPCEQAGCIALTVQEFDAKGRMTKQTFRNASGSPTTDKTGAYGYRFSFDLQGRVSIEDVLGPDENDANDRDGIQEYHLHYLAERPNLWFMTFADSAGKPGQTTKGADMRIILYDPVYVERQRARVDLNFSGAIVKIECLDESGNEMEERNCVNQSEIKTEFERIRPVLTKGDF